MQVKNLEHQLADTEKRLQEMVTASQRQTNVAQHEVSQCVAAGPHVSPLCLSAHVQFVSCVQFVCLCTVSQLAPTGDKHANSLSCCLVTYFSYHHFTEMLYIACRADPVLGILLWFMLQIDDLQQQLSQAISARRMAEADALRRAATLKQLEHRLGELSSEKDVSSTPTSSSAQWQHRGCASTLFPALLLTKNQTFQRLLV